MSSENPTPSPGTDRSPSHLLTALVAFTCGMAVMWFISHRGPDASARPETLPPAAQATPLPEEARTPAPPATPTQTLAEAVQAGHEFYDERRWMDAINRYEYAIANGGDHPDIRTNLGNCFRFIGEPEKALEQYAIAQRQNPRHEFSLFNTATLYIEVLNDMPRAVDTWRLYEARFPESINSERVHRFLSQNPRFAAALEATPEATPPPAAPATPAATPAARAHSSARPSAPPPKNAQLLDWMNNEAPPLPDKP